jgi:lipopolysaccharide/colanic/teichoic acid biosynthesis glycosyltransferase
MLIRFFDILFASIALFFLSPLLLLTALILRITGEGEVFFTQKRVGIDGKEFNLYKFATMLKNSPNIGTGTITVKDDPRVLPLGFYLRKTKINELPQLLNIFFGDMSVVGPRPLTEQTFIAYSESIQETIKQVKPGLSGIGSIIFRDEENIIDKNLPSVDIYNNVIAPYKGRIEKWFVERRGIYLYFLVIFITIWVVLSPSSKVHWKVFKKLPVPPDDLKRALNYQEEKK